MTDQFTHDNNNEQPTFEDAILELTSGEDSIPGPIVLYGLSGLSVEQIEEFGLVWHKLDPAYRIILMQMLVDVSESNFELDYRLIGWKMLTDESAEVRQAAIEILWEDESLKLMYRLIDMLQADSSVLVQAEAAKALGRFVLLGELGDLPESDTKVAQDALFGILDSPEHAIVIRCNALESIANCTHDAIRPLLAEAYKSNDDRLKRSAIVAMGRTCDYEQWGNIVLDEIESSIESLRLEAVRAAGELQAEDAVPLILHMLDDDNREMQEVAISALGEIGGKEASRALMALAEQIETDEDLELLIEEAIGNASLASGDLMMLDFDFNDVGFDG